MCKNFYKSLLLSSALTGLILPSALAQTSEDKKEDTVIVTGSRIQRTDINGPSPVQVFDTQEIDASGASTLSGFLFESNISGAGLVTENATLNQGGGISKFSGTSGFGADYTVVLVNGKRAPATPLGGTASVDLNTLPLGAIQSIEYLTDGASAIYGADAVAGVINIITKKNFEGLSISARTGIATKNKDAAKRTFSIVGGSRGERSSSVFTADYSFIDDINAKNRPLIKSANAPASLGGEDGRSPTGFPGTWRETGDGNNLQSFPAKGCPQESIRSLGSQGSECAYDFAPLYDARPRSERFVFTSAYHYDLTNTLTANAQFRYGRTETYSRNGAAPARFKVSKDAKENPYGKDIDFSRRAVDAGPRARDVTNSALVASIGLDWEFLKNQKLNVYYQRSRGQNNLQGIGGNLSRKKVSEAVKKGDFKLTESNTQEVIDAVSVNIHRQARLKEDLVNLSTNGLIDASFLQMQNPIGYAAGFEYRKENYIDTSDIAQEEGDVAGGASSNGRGGRNFKSVFGELSISPADPIEVSLALRYDTIHANDAGKVGNKLTYKLAAGFRPVSSLLFRASYGTGFKAPLLGSLYGGENFGVNSAVDTKNCNAAKAAGKSPEDIKTECRQQEIQSIGGGNKNLKPENSENISLGIVFEPANTGLRLSANYWNFDVKGIIGSLATQEILNNESLYQDRVVRFAGRLQDPDRSYVRSTLQNLSEQKAKGVDYILDYRKDIYSLGELSLNWRITQFLSVKRQTSAVQPLCEEAGTTSEPKVKSSVTLGWIKNHLSGNLHVRYLGKTSDQPGGRKTGTCDLEAPDKVRKVKSYFQVDLSGSYNIFDTDITLGIRNLLDKSPPASVSAGGGWPWYSQTLYDNVGRYVYIKISKSF